MNGAAFSGLTLTPDGSGWLCKGDSWHPDQPFYAVLGDPIDHSLSPRFQGAALRAANISHAYHAVQITHGELGGLLANRKSLALAGFNVTAPHKRTVADLCCELTDPARRTGAVNTVRVVDAGWVGHNTDVGGICEVVSDGTDRVRATSGLVLGAGGAARAAVAALTSSGVERLYVLARSGESYEDMRAWLDADPDCLGITTLLGWDAVRGISGPLNDCICVSCVPKGVAPPPELGDLLEPALWLDMNYGDGVTSPLFVPAARYRDGRPVLLAQGALSFTWWFDKVAPRRAMAEALNIL